MVSNSLEYLAVSDKNVNHLMQVEKGMTEREVMWIMHKPFKFEVIHLGEDVYDVWFYVTRTTVLDQTRMVPQNLTPLTFKNGILVGKGYDYYNFLVEEEENLLYPRPKKTQRKEMDESKGLERALEGRPTAMSNGTQRVDDSEQSEERPRKKANGYDWDEQAEEMQDEEEEQDFNFW